MERLVVVIIITVIAVAVATLVQRRRPADTPTPTGYHVPPQLHRPDFARPEAEWLVAVFTSTTCSTCAGVWSKVEVLESDSVAVDEVEVIERGDLHDRYAIDGVPTTVIADGEGVVRAHFLGPVTAADLWSALAELREEG